MAYLEFLKRGQVRKS